ATIPGAGLPNPVPAATVEVGYPRFPSPLAETGIMPAEELACRRALNRLGVRYRELPPIDDGGACRIDHPVEVSGLSGGVAMNPPATLTCAMAETIARWTRDEL